MVTLSLFASSPPSHQQNNSSTWTSSLSSLSALFLLSTTSTSATCSFCSLFIWSKLLDINQKQRDKVLPAFQNVWHRSLSRTSCIQQPLDDLDSWAGPKIHGGSERLCSRRCKSSRKWPDSRHRSLILKGLFCCYGSSGAHWSYDSTCITQTFSRECQTEAFELFHCFPKYVRCCLQYPYKTNIA